MKRNVAWKEFLDNFPEKLQENIDNHSSDGIYDLEISNAIFENKISSPIEMILYESLRYVLENEFYGSGSMRIFLRDSDGKIIKPSHDVVSDVTIINQYQIENYRVDFLITYTQFIYDIINEKFITHFQKSIVIECDGHIWHDTNEEQRRNEKKRERKIQSLGYKILRYTGSEIYNNSDNIAADIIEYLFSGKVIE